MIAKYLCGYVSYINKCFAFTPERRMNLHLESVQKRAIHIIFNFTRGMSYPNVLFVAQLESLDTFQDPFFKIFANQHPVFIISFHLPKIPPLPQG